MLVVREEIPKRKASVFLNQNAIGSTTPLQEDGGGEAQSGVGDAPGEPERPTTADSGPDIRSVRLLQFAINGRSERRAWSHARLDFGRALAGDRP